MTIYEVVVSFDDRFRVEISGTLDRGYEVTTVNANSNRVQTRRFASPIVASAYFAALLATYDEVTS